MNDTDLVAAERRSRLLVVAILTWAGLALAMIVTTLTLVASGAPLAGGAVTTGAVAVAAVAMVTTVVLWLAWFGALYRAAGALRPVRYPNNGTWLWAWLVPVVWWILPKQMVNDVWRAGGDDPHATPPWFVQAWWVAWVTIGVLRGFRRGGDLGAFGVVLALVGLVVGVSVFPLAVFTVRRLTSRLREAYDARQAAAHADAFAASAP